MVGNIGKGTEMNRKINIKNDILYNLTKFDFFQTLVLENTQWIEFTR